MKAHSNTVQSWRTRLNHRVGEQIFLQAHKDVLENEIDRKTLRLHIANVVAIFVLSLPYGIIVCGAYLIWASNFAWFISVIGLILMVLGVCLIPRQGKLPKNALHRKDAPAVFALIDAVQTKMSAPRIDYLVLGPDMTAFATQLRRPARTVLGFGAPLWAILDPKERLAILAHELPHLQNGDPNRSGLVHNALKSLDGWVYYLTPNRDLASTILHRDDFNTGSQTIGDILLGSVVFVIEMLRSLLLRLTFLESQRAEYFADAMGAKVAGKAATRRSLELSVLLSLVRIAFGQAYPIKGATGASFLSGPRQAMRNPDPEKRTQLMNAMRTEKSSLDVTQPPTVFRLAFLDLIDDPESPALDIEDLMAAADLELAPRLERIGADLMDAAMNT